MDLTINWKNGSVNDGKQNQAKWCQAKRFRPGDTSLQARTEAQLRKIIREKRGKSATASQVVEMRSFDRAYQQFVTDSVTGHLGRLLEREFFAVATHRFRFDLSC